MNYGQRSNTQLLLSYGFALHPNSNDTFTVSLGATPRANPDPAAEESGGVGGGGGNALAARSELLR